MYDLIGDIHGHARALERLLTKLGYGHARGAWRHPERRAVFLGDFIDRGPRIRDTLAIVRAMADAGTALAVLGNHELNALAHVTPDPAAPAEFLRRHTPKNLRQLQATLGQLAPGEFAAALAWFRTLPLWLDLGGLRVVHACWDERRMAHVGSADRPIDDAFLAAACSPRGDLHEPVEAILKGKEARLPPGVTFRDKDGSDRTKTRVRWYDAPEGHSFRSYALAAEPIDSDASLPEEVIAAAVPYPETAVPVFVGHYWLSGERPRLLRDNVACLDWSVARGGFLCAYRWDGERTLDPAKFVTAEP
jgi:hypothetical protein